MAIAGVRNAVQARRNAAPALQTRAIVDVTIYPNPATDIVHVESVDDLLEEISILDRTGRVITTRNHLNASRMQLDVSGLAKGAYWIKVSCGIVSTTEKLILK